MIYKPGLTSVLILLLILSTLCGASAEPSKLSEKKLTVAVLPLPPYSMQDEDGNWEGITVDLWKEIARITGTAYEFKKYDVKGLTQGQKSGEIEIAATGLSITSQREKVFDFSDPYMAATEAVAINSDEQPNLLQVMRSTLLNWTMLSFILLLVLTAFAGAFVLWLLERKGESDHYKGKNPRAFARSLFWSTMVMSGREFPKAVGWSTVSPTTFAGRLFAIFWMMFGIALVSIMTAATAFVLTSRQLQGMVHDADDLRHVKVGTVELSVGDEYLKHLKIKCDRSYQTPQALLQALADHKIDAAVYNRHVMVYFTRKMFANKITVLTIPLRQDYLAIPMRTGFPLKEQINQALEEIIESKKWQEIVSNYLGNDWINSSATR